MLPMHGAPVSSLVRELDPIGLQLKILCATVKKKKKKERKKEKKRNGIM